MLEETIHHQARTGEENRNLLLFGLRLVESKYQLGLFIIKELKRRLDAIDTSARATGGRPAKEPPKLPVSKRFSRKNK